MIYILNFYSSFIILDPLFLSRQEDKLDLTSSNIKSQEKLQNVLMMIKIYEALICFRIGAWSIDCSDNPQSVKNLFKGYARLVEFTKVTNT